MNPFFRVFALTCLLAHLSIASGFAQSKYFLDDFADGDHQDGEPANWQKGGWPGGELFVNDDHDLVIEDCLPGGCAIAPQNAGGFIGYSNISMRLQARVTDGVASIVPWARWTDPRSYYGSVRPFSNAVVVGLGTGGTGEEQDEAEFTIDAEKDVVLKFDVIGDEISLTAWGENDAHSELPLVSFRDDDLRSGLAGVSLFADDLASVAYRWIEFAEIIPGDVDTNSVIDVADIDYLSKAVREGLDSNRYDANRDGSVNADDHSFWVKEVMGTWFGDANLDGEFNSSDMVRVFQAGEFEDELSLNSTWATGDWNGDGEFESGDLVKAFQDGGYEQGPLPNIGVVTVPEPRNLGMISLGILLLRGASRVRCGASNRPRHAIACHYSEVQKSEIWTKIIGLETLQMRCFTTALLVCVAAFEIGATAQGQIVFREDFEDNNINDGMPVTWITRPLATGSYEVSDGNLIFKAGADFRPSDTALAADPIDFVMTDTSVISQIRGQDLDNMGIGARWNETDTTGYFAGITAQGLIFIGACRGPMDCPLLGSFQTDGLNPDSEDVMLGFSAIGETLTASAWRPGEAMPALPLVALVDTQHTIGTPAIFANPLPNGQAIYRFINVAESDSFLPVGRFGRARPVAGEINRNGSIDASPAISNDGLELIFKSNRDDPNDLYRVTRSSADQPFGNLEILDPLNTQFDDNGANLSSDELTLYFSSDRDSGFGDHDLYQATRKSRNDPFESVMNLGERLNTEFTEISPDISPDGLELYFASDRPGGLGGWDIWVARRKSMNEPFGDPVNLGPNINSPYLDGTPTLSSDGLNLIYTFEEVSNADLQIASRPSKESAFGPAAKLDSFGLGSSLHSSSTAESDPVLSPDWPAPGSKIYYTRWMSSTEADLWEATWSINGDIDFDGLLTVEDIDAIIGRIGRRSSLHDINQDGAVSFDDVRIWVEELKHTYFGDANLDGEFNSGDLTAVFQAGQYEDGVAANSTWATGDWNGDGEFDTSDLVKAFQGRGYEQGPKHKVTTVPEPGSLGMIAMAILVALTVTRERIDRGTVAVIGR